MDSITLFNKFLYKINIINLKDLTEAIKNYTIKQI